MSWITSSDLQTACYNFAQIVCNSGISFSDHIFRLVFFNYFGRLKPEANRKDMMSILLYLQPVRSSENFRFGPWHSSSTNPREKSDDGLNTEFMQLTQQLQPKDYLQYLSCKFTYQHCFNL